jgi:GGDEF domain-containing protein
MATFLAKLQKAEEGLRKTLAPKLPLDPKDSHSYMAPGLLNRKAWEAHIAKAKPGVVVAMDANHFSRLNSTFGYHEGDGAIKAIGNALHAAAQGTKGTVAHLGGDRFAAHFEDPEEANNFARAAENHVNGLLPVVGPALHDPEGEPQVHHHSLAVGMGSNHEEALHAQELGRQPYAVPGHAPTTVRSLHPAHLQPAPIAKSEVDSWQAQLWEDELAKSVPLHDGPEAIPVYYLRNLEGPVTANGPVVQGWLEIPDYDRKGQYLALASADKVWGADEGVAFRL